jgi:replication-associated recombination protein RarA
VGRDDLLDRMLDRLGDPSTDNVIILHGPPGVGKSELAREFARRNRSRYPGGTFAIDAGSDAATIDIALSAVRSLISTFHPIFASRISASVPSVPLARHPRC